MNLESAPSVRALYDQAMQQPGQLPLLNSEMSAQEKVHNTNRSKVDVHGWSIKDRPGVFKRISKHLLDVDHQYQREHIAKARVLELAKGWSWAACGTIGVAKREDGTFWVFDGQHRKLAADKRADITELPCMVFDVADLPEEARAFVMANTNRGPVTSADRFKGQLQANDPLSCEIKALVERFGYKISWSKGPNTLVCVYALMREYRADPNVTIRMLELCCILHDGKPIIDRVLVALCHLERYLSKKGAGSLCDRHNMNTLGNAGLEKIKQKVSSASGFYNRGGGRVWAEGLVTLLNYRRTTRRVPSLMAEEDEEEATETMGDLLNNHKEESNGDHQ